MSRRWLRQSLRHRDRPASSSWGGLSVRLSSTADQIRDSHIQLGPQQGYQALVVSVAQLQSAAQVGADGVGHRVARGYDLAGGGGAVHLVQGAELIDRDPLSKVQPEQQARSSVQSVKRGFDGLLDLGLVQALDVGQFWVDNRHHGADGGRIAAIVLQPPALGATQARGGGGGGGRNPAP